MRDDDDGSPCRGDCAHGQGRWCDHEDLGDTDIPHWMRIGALLLMAGWAAALVLLAVLGAMP